MDDHWIYPGWVLVLPPCAAGEVPTGSPTDAAAGPSSAAAGPTDPTAAGPSSAAPVPPAAAPVPPAATATVPTAAATLPARMSDAPPSPSLAGSGSARFPSPSSIVRPPVHRGVDVGELVEFGVLAAAFVGLLDRLRRVQHRHRPSGLRIALPPADVAALEQRLRRRAEGRSGPTPAAAWARAHRLLMGAGQEQALAAVRVGAGSVEVLPASAVTQERRAVPPPPLEPGTQPGWWLLPPVGDPAADAMVAPPPALVTLGRQALLGLQPPVECPAPVPADAADPRPPGDAALLCHQPSAGHPAPAPAADLAVDLAVLGLLSVAGPGAESVCRAMAVELASAGSDDLELVLVGFDPAFEAFDRVRRCEDPALATAIAQRRVAEHVAARCAAPSPATLPRRAPDSLDSAAGTDAAAGPGGCTVVICLPRQGWGTWTEAEQTTWERLVDLGRAATGALAVVTGWSVPGPGWQLSDGVDGRADLRWVGSSPDRQTVPAQGVEVQRMGRDPAAKLAAAVRTAADLGGVEVPLVPPEAGQEDDGSPPGVEISVLGPVEVRGAERPFTRAWTLELVVYLALHPAGATTEQWATALWPDRLPAPATLHSTASAARRALGGDPSGADHLPRSHGRLQLAATVTTDWRQVEAAARREDPGDWRRALELVRGRPLQGLRVIDWALLDGVLPAMEATVVDLADRYGRWCLEREDPYGAEWAARRALLVCPYDERLYRILLRAADMAGNPAGVEAAMAELVRLVAEDVEPYDAVHPETLELYRALSRRGAPTIR